MIQADAKAQAKMNEAIGLYNTHGYAALLNWAGYHLFPDFIGGKNDEVRAVHYEDCRKFLGLVMENASPWIVGDQITLADCFVAPVIFYVAMVEDAQQVMGLPGVAAWWGAVNAHATYKETEPVLG